MTIKKSPALALFAAVLCGCASSQPADEQVQADAGSARVAEGMAGSGIDPLDVPRRDAEASSDRVDAGEASDAAADADAGPPPLVVHVPDSSVPDAAPDAAMPVVTRPRADASPACECDSGPCCDGCAFRPPTWGCGEAVSASECVDGLAVARPWVEANCGARDWDLGARQEWRVVHCSGSSRECDGAFGHVVRTAIASCFVPDETSVCIDGKCAVDAECLPSCPLHQEGYVDCALSALVRGTAGPCNCQCDQDQILDGTCGTPL